MDSTPQRPPLPAAESVAGAFLVVAAVPPAWSAVLWLTGRPGPDTLGAVAVLLDAGLLLLAGVLTFWRPRWVGTRTAVPALLGLLLGTLQWLVESLVGIGPTWLVSVLALVLLVWLALSLVPQAESDAAVD